MYFLLIYLALTDLLKICSCCSQMNNNERYTTLMSILWANLKRLSRQFFRVAVFFFLNSFSFFLFLIFCFCFAQEDVPHVREKRKMFVFVWIEGSWLVWVVQLFKFAFTCCELWIVFLMFYLLTNSLQR